MKRTMIKLKRDLHPLQNTAQTKKRKRAAFEAMNRIERDDLDRKDGLMSPVKEPPNTPKKKLRL
jgi:hypothetical protein